MSELVEMKPGDFAVVDRTYRWIKVKVEKVASVQFKASGEWSGRASTYQRRQVVYSGPEDTASKLLERLTSSDALFNDERRKASERREKRNEDLIAQARGS